MNKGAARYLIVVSSPSLFIVECTSHLSDLNAVLLPGHRRQGAMSLL